MLSPAIEPEANLMLARYYSSGLARFMAVDPANDSAAPENPQSWNRYAYAGNNPLRYVDPDGRAYTSQTGQELHNQVMTESNRSATDKKVVAEAAASPQPIDVQTSPQAGLRIGLPNGGSLEIVADLGTFTGDVETSTGIMGMMASQQMQGNTDLKALGDVHDANFDATTGAVIDAKVTLLDGSYDISADGSGNPNKSRADFRIDSFIEASAHVGGTRYRTEPEVEKVQPY